MPSRALLAAVFALPQIYPIVVTSELPLDPHHLDIYGIAGDIRDLGIVRTIDAYLLRVAKF